MKEYLNKYIKELNRLLAAGNNDLKLSYLLDAAVVEIFRRIIFIIDDYFVNKNKQWLSDMSMHSAAFFESKLLKEKLA